ncbi:MULTISPECIES: zinc ribbon domain-containing protein [unclassified Exiguobacterium]|uniref:zinc ribbon domain-containing protein n=1 Tax=unclassified Exiguobacterium TaxID=2644629 RepID=UPI001BED0156|nr:MULTISPECIES: zinc ribbon domain-containing protein [unclassified Exiguobacterium]
MRYCHQCGHANEDHNQYCERDGVQLEVTDTTYRFDVSTGQFCTSCGTARASHELYCHACGQTALEPATSVNRVEESLRTVAATGTQVMSQLRRVAGKRDGVTKLSFSTESFRSLRMNQTDVVRGSLFGIGFLLILLLIAGSLVAMLPAETIPSLADELEINISSFNATMFLAFLIGAKVYWSVTTEQVNQFIASLGAGIGDFLRIEGSVDAQFGNYFMMYGGIFLMITIVFFLIRHTSTMSDVLSRMAGFIVTVLVGYGLVYAFAFHPPLFEVAWFKTISSTFLMLLFTLGLAYLITMPFQGEWKIAQQGVRGLLTVTLVSTFVGIGYFGFQLSKIDEGERLEFVDSEEMLYLTGQAASMNWQTIGHGGEQSLMLQSPLGSYEIGMSLFGDTAPQKITNSIETVSEGFGGVEDVLWQSFSNDEGPVNSIGKSADMLTVSPMIFGTLTEMYEAELANDDARYDALYQEGVFSWLLILLVLNIVIYAMFAKGHIHSWKSGIWFIAPAIIGFIVWQWFLNNGMFVELSDIPILGVATDGLSIAGTFIALVLITIGALLGWGMKKLNIN